LINYAQEHGFVSDDDLKLLRKWREDPQGWGKTLNV
jgi:orotate phosphoribosyltransferase